MHDEEMLITADEAMCRLGQATKQMKDYVDDTVLDRDTLIEAIGVFGAPTATQAGTMGLVPAPPAE